MAPPYTGSFSAGRQWDIPWASKVSRGCMWARDGRLAPDRIQAAAGQAGDRSRMEARGELSTEGRELTPDLCLEEFDGPRRLHPQGQLVVGACSQGGQGRGETEAELVMSFGGWSEARGEARGKARGQGQAEAEQVRLNREGCEGHQRSGQVRAQQAVQALHSPAASSCTAPACRCTAPASLPASSSRTAVYRATHPRPPTHPTTHTFNHPPAAPTCHDLALCRHHLDAAGGSTQLLGQVLLRHAARRLH